MRHAIGKLTLFLVLLTFVSRCTNEIEYDLMKGTLKGTVDKNNTPVTVLLEGDNLSSTIITDGSGCYSFDNIPTGTYNLQFTKEGYGTCYIYGLGFIGGDSVTETVPLITLAQLPDASVSNLAITEIKVDTVQYPTFNIIRTIVYYTADFSPDNGLATNYMAFLSSDPKVSCRNYMVDYSIDASESKDQIDLSGFNATFFKRNTTLYMVIYPYSSSTGSGYIDMDTGCRVHSGIQTEGASNVASVIVK